MHSLAKSAENLRATSNFDIVSLLDNESNFLFMGMLQSFTINATCCWKLRTNAMYQMQMYHVCKLDDSTNIKSIVQSSRCHSVIRGIKTACHAIYLHLIKNSLSCNDSYA